MFVALCAARRLPYRASYCVVVFFEGFYTVYCAVCCVVLHLLLLCAALWRCFPD
jgi:hypothetical protein